MSGKRKRRTRLKSGTRVTAQPASQVSLARWDRGAMGQANRIGLVEEERGERDIATGKVINPNDVRGARRVDMLETYHLRGVITDRGYTAGEALRDAWAGTQRAPGTDWSQTRVDSTPKPDKHIDILVDRVSKYHWIARLVHKDDLRILTAVVEEGRIIASLPEYRALNYDKGKAHLRAALERLADQMEGRK